MYVVNSRWIWSCLLFLVFECIVVLSQDSAVFHQDSSFAGTGTSNFGTFRSPFLSKFTGFIRSLFDRSVHPPLLNATAPDCKFPTPVCDPRSRYRTADGYCNNLKNPSWGTPGWPFKRILPSLYDDGVNTPRTTTLFGDSLPSPRAVSRTVHTHDSDSTAASQLTSMFTQFGQFLDHDMDLTPLTNGDSELDCCEETIQFPVRNFYEHPPTSSVAYKFKSRPLPGTCFPITIPQPDRIFKDTCMNFVRSKVFAPTFKCISPTREQGNAVTSFIDASQVYGSTPSMQKAVREYVRGRLNETSPQMLPSNSTTTCKSSKLAGKYCFGAGDLRVNEQPMLSSLHVVFHRYHNHIAEYLSSANTHWDDERVFQEARKIVGAVMQHIVYTEYLPLLLGSSHMVAYGLTSGFFHRYEPHTDPRIINSFATAAFRFGHSMVPGQLKFGTVKHSLESSFFCPHKIQDTENVALDDLLKGTLNDLSQGSDRYFSTALSEKLFLDKEQGRSLDLVALNIQRGRDHGLPSYNDFREACGLSRVDSGHPDAGVYLSVYRDMDDIDLFSGALAESHVPGGIVGDTFACIIARQFRDLKYGDRYWYESIDSYTSFTRAQLRAIKRVSLASIFCSVTGITRVQPSVFRPVSFGNGELPCDQISRLDLSNWITDSFF